jgi:acyl-coenzyme A thioesterase PaaI-like protein
MHSGMNTTAQLAEFLAQEFPQTRCTVEAVGGMAATVKHPVGKDADVGLYVAILGEIGLVPLTVTTSLSINFLRKPAADRAIIGVCKLLKVGKTLATGEVTLYSEGVDEPVAHAVGTYSIPQKSSR